MALNTEMRNIHNNQRNHQKKKKISVHFQWRNRIPRPKITERFIENVELYKSTFLKLRGMKIEVPNN